MAITSDVQICNLALLRLGTNPITSLGDGTPAANACNIYYQPTRESLLRRHFWNFSLVRANLAADAIGPAFGFANQYTLPSNFIRVKEIYNQMSPYKIEGMKLLTDDGAPLKLLYVSNITDPTKFDALFVEAFVLSLIVKIGPRVQGDGFNPNVYINELERVLMDAKMVNSQDGTAPRIKANTYLESRISGSTSAIGEYFYMDY